jgi:hypothetical protein
MSRQGKVRLAKWYSTYSQKERARVVKETTPLVLSRPLKLCNFVDWKNLKLVYKRYASLYFLCGVDSSDNELLVLEIIHHFVEVCTCRRCHHCLQHGSIRDSLTSSRRSSGAVVSLCVYVTRIESRSASSGCRSYGSGCASVHLLAGQRLKKELGSVGMAIDKVPFLQRLSCAVLPPCS